VIGVAAGDSHSLVCTLEGHVYGWGCYKDREGKMFFNAMSEREVRFWLGVFGLGGFQNSKTLTHPTHPNHRQIKRKQERPMRLPGLENVLEIRSGVSANLALLSDSTVVSWGIGGWVGVAGLVLAYVFHLTAVTLLWSTCVDGCMDVCWGHVIH
jgi:regulator of chromosome condensation